MPSADALDDGRAIRPGAGREARTLVLSVAASSQAMLAEPRLVTRISPSSATAPATPGNPGSVAMWRPAIGIDHLDVLRAVWAMKTRRLFGSKMP